jgi:hypothetical protein
MTSVHIRWASHNLSSENMIQGVASSKAVLEILKNCRKNLRKFTMIRDKTQFPYSYYPDRKRFLDLDDHDTAPVRTAIRIILSPTGFHIGNFMPDSETINKNATYMILNFLRPLVRIVHTGGNRCERKNFELIRITQRLPYHLQ